MGMLHDRLKSIGYEGHALEVYLVRLLFCLFADNTTIFNKNTFYDYVLNLLHLQYMCAKLLLRPPLR